jgi:glycerol-3-phosphate acyltransferase PlsY
MNTLALIIFLIFAYLIGSIPFGYLLVKSLKGQDLRQIGSGNIGATNVRRVMGWTGFFTVLVLDALKGYGPVVGFPLLAQSVAGWPPSPWFPPALAVMTILGHNFPLYLKFRGGKGVATSLGAVFGLAPLGIGLAVIGFLASLGLTGWVSLSSLVGGAIFLVYWFISVDNPFFSTDSFSTIVFLLLYVMMILRHRANLKRILQGTEPKIWNRESKSFGSNQPTRTGRVASGVIPILAIPALALVIGTGHHWSRPTGFENDILSIQATERIPARWQRATHLAWWQNSSRLAVSHPRFNRIAIHEWNEQNRSFFSREIELEGRPEAIATDPTDAIPSLLILQSAGFEGVHLKPGWIQAFDTNLNPLGDRFEVGDYPKDLVILPRLCAAAVLTAGRAEGDPNRDPPRISLIELDERGCPARVRSYVELNNPLDQPQSLAVRQDETATYLAVACFRSRRVIGFDIHDATSPRELGAITLPFEPGGLSFSGHRLVVAAHYEGRLALVDAWSCPPQIVELPPSPLQGQVVCLGSNHCLIAQPHDSSLILVDFRKMATHETVAVRGFANLTGTRPHFMAFDPNTGRLAVANYSGGSVHLFSTKIKLMESLTGRSPIR